MTYVTELIYDEYLKEFSVDDCKALNEFYQELQLIIANSENYPKMLHEINDATIIRYDLYGYTDIGMKKKIASSYAFTLISEKPYTKAESSAIVGKLSAGLVEKIACEVKIDDGVSGDAPGTLG